MLVTGMDPEIYCRMVPMPTKITRGSASVTGTDILIGTELSTDLGVDIGDKLRVTGSGTVGVAFSLTVAGIFDLGNKGVNARSAFVSLRTAQTLMGLPGGVTAIDVTVHDVYAAEAIAQRIAGAAPGQADSWIKTNSQFFSAIANQSMANNSIRFFVGLSVAFGIASVLVVTVVQKSSEIGVLRAMGITRGEILRVFILQGALLGLGDAIVGSGLGMLALATVTGLVAAFAPALRATRLDPVVAING